MSAFELKVAGKISSGLCQFSALLMGSQTRGYLRGRVAVAGGSLPRMFFSRPTVASLVVARWAFVRPRSGLVTSTGTFKLWRQDRVTLSRGLVLPKGQGSNASAVNSATPEMPVCLTTSTLAHSQPQMTPKALKVFREER